MEGGVVWEYDWMLVLRRNVVLRMRGMGLLMVDS